MINWITLSGGLLLQGNRGIFSFDGERVAALPGGEATGFVYDAHYLPSGGLLLASNRGLFRYDNARITPIAAGDVVGPVRWHDLAAGRQRLLLTTDRRFFELDMETMQIAAVPGSQATAIVNSSRDLPNGRVLFATNRGLFLFDGTKTIPVRGGETVSYIADVRESADRSLLIATDDGLFVSDGLKLSRVPGEPIGKVVSWHQAPDATGMLLLTELGWFHFDGSRVTPLPGAEAIGWQGAWFQMPGRGLLLATNRGLFRFDGHRPTPFIGTEKTGGVSGVVEAPGLVGLLLSAERGWFYLEGGQITPIPGNGPTGTIRTRQEGLEDRNLAVLTEFGVSLAVYKPLGSASVRVDSDDHLQGSGPDSRPSQLRFRFQHPCAPVAADLGLHMRVRDPQGRETTAAIRTVDWHDDTAEIEAPIAFPAAGIWTLALVSTSPGRDSDIGEPIKVKIEWSWRELLQRWWFIILPLTGFVLAFVWNACVFVLARYRPAWLEYATDDNALKTKLTMPLQLALKYWGWGQLWVLHPYVRSSRAALLQDQNRYLPIPLRGPDAVPPVSGAFDLALRWKYKQHLWVRGRSGMGKTTLISAIQHQHFCGNETTPFAIFHRCGYVLVPVEARRFADATTGDNTADAWVLGCVARALARRHIVIDGPSGNRLLRGMLRRGTLAVAIDGLNEVARESALRAFVDNFPRVRVLVTSQEEAEEQFETWDLPATVSEHVDGLLDLYLGSQSGAAVARQLRNTGLMDHLRSGYDVRLVADLAGIGVALPLDRLGLYEKIMHAAVPEGIEGDDLLRLLKAAAWKIMSNRGPNEDKRRLKPAEDLEPDLLNKLTRSNERQGHRIRLVRQHREQQFEFVHDEMNAFLAACWLLEQSTMEQKLEHLTASKAWQEDKGIQESLWSFVAQMVEDHESAQALWNFAAGEQRHIFRKALEQQARRRGWPLTFNPPLIPTAISANTAAA